MPTTRPRSPEARRSPEAVRSGARIVPALFLPALLLWGCGAPEPEPADEPAVTEAPAEVVAEVASDAPGYLDIPPDDWAERLGDPGVLVVNVHVPFEGEIPGTHAHVPFNALDDHLGELPSDLDAPVALYCMGDGMSVIAAAELAEMGYSNVIRLDGGMQAWNAAGYTLEGVEEAPEPDGE